jgi:dephospho-CoA kinase
MSQIEEKDLAKISDLATMIARKQYAYPTHLWKEEQAKRLYEFLKKHDRFTRESLRNWLYRELYVLRLKKQESPFIRKVLNLMLDELTFKKYIECKNGIYKVIKVPSYDECLKILRMQWFDLWKL